MLAQPASFQKIVQPAWEWELSGNGDYLDMEVDKVFFFVQIRIFEVLLVEKQSVD
jgi:hypothetical protein